MDASVMTSDGRFGGVANVQRVKNPVLVAAKVRAALKPGGRLAIISYRVDANPPDPSAPEPKFRVSRDQTLAEADQAGFALDREETYLPHQFFLILKVK